MIAERAERCSHPISKRLLKLIADKKTNLSLSVDVTDKASLLRLAEEIGPSICVLKTHIDILSDFDANVPDQLRALADKHNFLIFEDRKFADIGNTVKHQYEGGIYQIARWADIINAHIVPGPGIIKGLQEIGLPLGRGLLLLAQMSSEGTLANGAYTHEAINMAKAFPDFVMGFISREQLCDNPNLIHMTPGVKLEEGVDALGQQYLTPEMAIAQGNDIIIVGRGIIGAEDPVSTAQEYRARAFSAYEAHCKG